MPHTTFAAPVAALLRDVFWKSLPVFALAGLASLALRRASSAKRHALWLLTLAALLCLPLFCALLPRWAAPVLPAAPRLAASAPRDLLPTEQARVVAPPAPPLTQTAPTQTAPAPVVPNTVAPTMTEAAPPPAPVVAPPPVRPPGPARPVTAAPWVCLAWLVGVLLVAGRTLLGLAAAGRLVRRCRVVTAGPLVEAADAARQALGLTRPLTVRVGPVAVPMTCGVARPVVLLPDAATDWPEGRLRAVLLHEAAHVQRFDWATMLLARCVCALYWPHPLVWLAVHRLRAEAEGACDDRVLTHGGIPAPDYAAHLLEIVRALSSRRAPSVATVAMASRPEVSARLRTILDAQQARSGVNRRGLVLAALTALAILAPLAALRPVSGRNPGAPEANGSGSVQTVSWTTTTQFFDAHGRRQKSREGQPITEWIQRDPPKIVTEQPSGFSTVLDRRGVFTRTAQGDTQMGQFPLPDGQRDIAGEVEAKIKYCTDTPGPYTGKPGTKITFTPWRGSEAVLNGRQVRLMTRNVYMDISQPVPVHADSTVWRWLDTSTARLLRSESDIASSGFPGDRIISTSSDFRYNQPPPPGVLDWKPMPPLAAMHPVASAPQDNPEPLRVPGKPAMELRWGTLVIPSPFLPSADSPWVAMLPNGVRVRLLFVGAQDAQHNTVACWTPEGQLQKSATTAPTQAPVPGSYFLDCDIAVPPALRHSDGMIALEKATEGKVTDWDAVSYGFPGLGEYGGNGTQAFTFPVNFAAGQTQGAININLVIGPQTTLISVPPRTGGTHRLATGETVSITSLWSHGTADMNKSGHRLNIGTTSVRVTLPARFVRNSISYDFEPIARNGGRFRMAHGFGFGWPMVSHGTASLVYTCRTSELPLDQVKEFRFTYRPSYTAVFRNVALRSAAAPAPATSNAQTEKDRADQRASSSNLRHIGLGLMEYAQDHKEHFPDAAHWMDEIVPYLVSSISPQTTRAARQQQIAALFHDPAAPAGQTWSYAYNRALSGLSLAKVDSPASTVAVFESAKGTRNASDGGQSVPKPGWHTGGSDYLFTDGHAVWLGPGAATALFNPRSTDTSQAISVTGRVYDRKTLRPVAGSSVIFSHSSQAITPGSVFPWSFTHKTGKFQCALYPGKNYLMVLEGGRYVPISRQPMLYETSGGTARVTTMGPAAHQYIINLSMPNAYALAGESHPDKAAGLDVMAFVPVTRATLKPVTGAAPTAFTSAPALPMVPSPSAPPAPQPAAQTKPDDRARFLAGLTPVRGPGVVVTLNDSRKPLPKSFRILPPGVAPPNLIHDTDINMVVSVLKAAGAEAIAVNGERLVAVSPIHSAGAMVLVNSAALTPPYVVRAIGAPAQLQAAINLPGGVADQIRAFDPAMIRVQASPRLTLPAYHGTIPDRYARPVASIGMRPHAIPAPSESLLPTPQFPQMGEPVGDFQRPVLGGGSLMTHTPKLPLMQSGPHMMVVTPPAGRRFSGLFVTPPQEFLTLGR